MEISAAWANHISKINAAFNDFESYYNHHQAYFPVEAPCDNGHVLRWLPTNEKNQYRIVYQNPNQSGNPVREISIEDQLFVYKHLHVLQSRIEERMKQMLEKWEK